MRAFEFRTTLTASRVLDLPTDLKTRLEPGLSVRVILLLPEPTEEKEWARLTAEQFLGGYAESDRVYDRL